MKKTLSLFLAGLVLTCNGALINDAHILYVSPTSTKNFAVRGDVSQPAGLFWSLTGGPPTGVCAQATNGDTIVVLPGNYLATAIPLNAGVKMIGVGNPFIQRTNFFISGTNATVHGPNIPMILVNDNTLIEGISFQCLTNQYDAIIGPNVINQLDYPQDPIQGTSIQTGDPFALHELFVYPEYGFTNLQVMATNCTIRNCVFRGATDILYGTGNTSLQMVFSNAVYGAGVGYEVLVTSNFPPTDIRLENVISYCQWDHIRMKGDNGVSSIRYITEHCSWYTTSDMTVAVGGGGTDGTARSVFLVGDGVWIDNGSDFHLSPGTRINAVMQLFNGRAFLNGTKFFLTNAIVATDQEIMRSVRGYYHTANTNGYTVFVGTNMLSYGTISMNSNSFAYLPPIPKGGVTLWSSNGVLYSINSNPAGVLTTNKLAP